MLRLFLAAALLWLAVTPAMSQDIAAGEAAFRKCMPCHSAGENAGPRVGPVLNDIFGKPAGSQKTYAYSAALAEAGAAGLVWTPQTMAAFLREPRAFVVGNKMTFAGLRNEEELANIIAYLMTFSPGYEAPSAPGDKLAR